MKRLLPLVIVVLGSVRLPDPGPARTYDVAAGPAGFEMRQDGRSVRLRLAALSTGDGTRVFDTPAWTRGTDRVEADYGGGVVERYLLESTRAEQVIEIARKPLRPGPIEAVIEAEGSEFRYEGAMAVDAAGAREPLLVRREPGRIVLHLPPHAVDRAQFPLLLDPWLQLGGSGTGTGITGSTAAYYPSMALDSSGNPAIAFTAITTNYEIYFMRWNGSAWVELGGSATGGGVSNTTGYSYQPSLGIDSTGNPVIAWYEIAGSNYEIYLRRWNGTAWVELGGSATGGGLSNTAGYSFYPSLALDSAGNPGVAWTELGTNYEVLYRQWNGSSWAELAGSGTGGGVSANAGTSYIPSLRRIASSGYPGIAWYDTTGGNSEIYYRQWNGGAWAELAGSATSGGVSANAGGSSAPVLALDASGNPRIAWVDITSTPAQIFYRQWNGSAWAELGGSGSGSGASNSATAVSSGWVDVDSAGQPVVAWAATGTGSTEIFLRRWNGSAWIGIGGSDTGGGVSNSLGASSAPIVRVDSAGLPQVAWNDSSGGAASVYFRGYEDIPASQFEQHLLDGTAIPVGGSTPESAVLFRVSPIPNMDRNFRLQVDFATLAGSLDGVPDAESPLVPATAAATLTLPMANGSYRWQGRLVDNASNPLTEWIEFGANPAGDLDVAVSFTGSGGVTVVEEDDDKKFCVGSAGGGSAAPGLLAGLALLGLLLRRR